MNNLHNPYTSTHTLHIKPYTNFTQIHKLSVCTQGFFFYQSIKTKNFTHTLHIKPFFHSFIIKKLMCTHRKFTHKNYGI